MPQQHRTYTHETIVLAGNPNVGKSVVFGALTDTYAAVSNFPGTTVEILEDSYRGGTLIDSPGVYGVSNLSTEEQVTRDVLLRADKVVDVIDGTHLERDLFFTLQLIDMGLPLVIFVNMMDEAAKNGIHIDFDLMSDLLGVPVFFGSAQNKEGIDELEEGIAAARPGIVMNSLKGRFAKLVESGIDATQAQMCLAFEGDVEIAERAGLAAATDSDAQENIYIERRDRVNDIVGHIMTTSTEGANWQTKLSAAMMHPITGIPLMLALFVFIWVVIGQGIGVWVVGFLEKGIMNRYWVPLVQHLFTSVGLGAGSLPYQFLAGEFGIFTMVPSYIFGVILPLVAAFYLLLSLLEDSGYLPRIAVLTDKLLSFFGLNGRAIIPLILGFGCVTMGTLTTRVLTSKRERMIATALMAIAVPCSAQIAAIAAMMGRTPIIYSAIFVVFLLMVFGVVGTALNKMMPGESTDLLIDLPPLRIPQTINVLKKTSHKVYGFLTEIVKFFAAGSLIITLLQVTGALGWIINAASPLVVGWMGLPAKAATAFVMGFIRRDFAAAGFFSMNLTNGQLLVAMSTITLFVPCIASAIVILKERGVLYFLTLFITTTTLAFGLGGVMMHILTAVGL
ncbi:MAG: ferrous iron transport protein B [Coriobacteriia bacterium]|nr:ferrous iron transport protein B [Coriobacteriia bacterium]